jgi:hypothetical protein
MAKNVWDGFGRRIGSISKMPDGKTHVYDSCGQPLGNVAKTGTFTPNGKLVSRTPMAGLLFNRTTKQKK